MQSLSKKIELGVAERDGHSRYVSFKLPSIDEVLKALLAFSIIAVTIIGFNTYFKPSPKLVVGVFDYDNVVAKVRDELTPEFKSDHLLALNAIRAVKRADSVLNDIMHEGDLTLIIDNRYVLVNNIDDYEVIDLSERLTQKLVEIHLSERGA